jgi:hypothetical protein
MAGLKSVVRVRLLLGLIVAGCAGGNVQGRLQAPVNPDAAIVQVPREPFDRAFVERCGRGGPTSTGSAALGRPPYVQKVTRSAAEVLFTTRDST